MQVLDGVTRESIKPLLELQRIDSATDRLRARRANLPEQRELDELAEQRAQVQGVLTQATAARDELARAQTKLETEVSQIDERHEHEQKRLYSGEVQNPRELSNIQAELDALTRRKSHLEDQELEIMEQREEADAEVARLAGEAGDLDGKIADTTARRDAATVEIDRELEGLAGERASILPSLDEELVGFYEELRGKYGGVAVGALEEGTCRACSLPLSPVALDAIKRSDDPMVRCENCRRLLIIP